MKSSTKHLFILTAILSVATLSCHKEVSCESCNPNNQPPFANTGPDQMIMLPKDSVLLDGSASSDPDGKIINWHWTIITGPSIYRIYQPDSAKTMVAGLVQGIYQFELKVTDDKGASATDTVQIAVNAATPNNRPPIACAGPDQVITLPVSTAVLNGNCSTDPDNNIVAYTWTKIAGPSTFSIVNPNHSQTQVSNLVAGTYVFQLKVTDAGGLFSFDTVQISVQNIINVDVYVAGQENNVATYWKNGQPVRLPSQSSATATSITLAGNDVYVAGDQGDFFTYGNNRAKYWKNGQELFLTGPTGAGTTCIVVHSGDVYVSGWEFSGTKTVAKYWKNGQPVALTNGTQDAEATCIIVIGNDVYVSGDEGGVAKYWKNGQAISLTDGTHQAFANSIVVVGNDIYVAGSEENGRVGVAKYWKNGQPVSLTDGTQYAYATSIAVNGSDVYVTGYEGDYYSSVAKYWKNGQPVSLPSPAGSALARCIFVYGTSVYIAGFDGGPNFFIAKYWENGQSVPLTGPSGAWANSILVLPH